MKAYIQIRWSVDDIRSLGFKCTDEEGMEVLEDVLRFHDAEQGINWYTLEYHAIDNGLKRDVLD